jgi:predicted XRE-type DNA-binding protein
MDGQRISDSDRAKRALGDSLTAAMDGTGLTQADLGRRLGVGQSEISALRRMDLQRFSIDRLLGLLAKLGRRVELTVRPGSASGTLEVRNALAGSDVLVDVEGVVGLDAGIVLVAGLSASGRTRLLDAIVDRHRSAGASTLLFARAAHPPIPTQIYRNADEFDELVIRAPRADVVAIDDFERVSEDAALAALHFARESRVYVTLSAEDAARAVGRFSALRGRPYRHIVDDSFMTQIRGIVTLRRLPARALGESAIVAELARTEHREGRWQTVVERSFEDAIADLVRRGVIDEPSREVQRLGPMVSAEDAEQFLSEVGAALKNYLVQAHPDDALCLEIGNAANGRTVSVSLARNRHSGTYAVSIATSEGHGGPGRTPVTRLFGAPADVVYVTTVARGFLETAASADS